MTQCVESLVGAIIYTHFINLHVHYEPVHAS